MNRYQLAVFAVERILTTSIAFVLNSIVGKGGSASQSSKCSASLNRSIQCLLAIEMAFVSVCGL